MTLTTLKKAAATTTVAISSILVAAPYVFAQDVNPCANIGDPWSKLCTISADRTGAIISSVVLLLFIIAALLALFFLIWGGIKWILSGGDKSKVEAARSTIIAALIGLVVTFLSFFLLTFVLSIFGISLANLTLPKLSVN